MSTSIISRLLGAGEAITGKVLRAVAGKDSAGNATPIAVDAKGRLRAVNGSVPEDVAERLQYFFGTFAVKKGQRNDWKSRLSVLGESQESSRKPVGIVTTDKVNHGPVTTGPFVVGEIVTGGTSGATGTITRVGARFFEFTPALGAFVVGEVVTGGTSGATATVTSVTARNIVGQIVKMAADNVDGLSVTVESQPASESLDLFEASQPTMQLMWTGAVPPVRDVANFVDGSASMQLDHSAANTYTHNVAFIEFAPVSGDFQLDEVITGQTSGATATIGAIVTEENELRLVSITGAFQLGETIIGGTSGATATITEPLKNAENWTRFKQLFFWMRVSSKPTDQHLVFSISDGTNTASMTFLASQVGVFDEQALELSVLAALGAPGPVDLSAITSYSFTTANKFKTGYTTNVDGLRLSEASGAFSVKFFDLGPTLPVSGTDTLVAGTPIALGDLGIHGHQHPAIRVELNGGKAILNIPDFIHGVAREIPSETFLTPGNYYAIAFEYLDTDVTIYGADPAFGVDYYPDGYAFSAPYEASPIVSVGPNQDCAFILYESDAVWIDRVEIVPDADVGAADFALVAEDQAMRLRVIGRGTLQGSIPVEMRFEDRPIYLPIGGKIELYYSDDVKSPVAEIGMRVRYWSAKADSYVSDPA